MSDYPRRTQPSRKVKKINNGSDTQKQIKNYEPPFIKEQVEGICCFCNEACNPCSQCCGRCARGGYY